MVPKGKVETESKVAISPVIHLTGSIYCEESNVKTQEKPDFNPNSLLGIDDFIIFSKEILPTLEYTMTFLQTKEGYPTFWTVPTLRAARVMTQAMFEALDKTCCVS